MVRYKARPQRDPKFSIPISTNSESTPADETFPPTDSQAETSSEEDVPLCQLLVRPAKRRKLQASASRAARSQHQQPNAAEQSWAPGSSKVCSFCLVEPHELYAFTSIAVEDLPESAPLSLSGHQRLKVFARCSASQQTKIEVLVVTPHGQYQVRVE